MSVQFHKTQEGRSIAYHLTQGVGPLVVFLGGFKSDMEGSKAIHLEDWARVRGQGYLRLDYSGHGQSSEAFTDGCIGDWAADALAIINAVTKGPIILVGSSMGGWIALWLSRHLADRIVGMVGIAAAPDFTEDSMWANFNEAQKAEMAQTGQVALPSEYGEPYIITKRLIEDGRDQLVLRDPLPLGFPVRLLHGTDDADVSMDVALRLTAHATCDDLRLIFVKHADHRFSNDTCLALIASTIEGIL